MNYSEVVKNNIFLRAISEMLLKNKTGCVILYKDSYKYFCALKMTAKFHRVPYSTKKCSSLQVQKQIRTGKIRDEKWLCVLFLCLMLTNGAMPDSANATEDGRHLKKAGPQFLTAKEQYESQ